MINKIIKVKLSHWTEEGYAIVIDAYLLDLEYSITWYLLKTMYGEVCHIPEWFDYEITDMDDIEFTLKFL